MFGKKLVTRNFDKDINSVGQGGCFIPENKMPLFIKVWSEIKEMGGSCRKDEETRGFSRNVVERMLGKNKLSIDMGYKILAYHKKLKGKK